MRKITEENAGFGTFIAFSCLPLSGMTTDVYLPSLPAMSSAFHTSPSVTQLSLTFFMIGIGVTQFFIGNVLDSFGRYRTGVVALFLFVLSNVALIYSPNIWVVNVLRLLQGVCVGSVVVGKRAFFVDVFQGDRLKGFLSWFTIVWSAGPILAPFLGGYLQEGFGWQANFVFLAFYAGAILVLELLFGGESLRHRQRFHLPAIAERYRTMLTHSGFMLSVLNLVLAYSAIFVFSLSAPFIIEHTLQQSPVVTGYAALLMGFAWMVGGLIAKSQLHRGLIQKHAVIAAEMLGVAIVMLLISVGTSNLVTLLLCCFLVHVAAGALYNIYFTECLTMFPKNAGLASGLAGGCAFLLTSVASYGVVAAIDVRGQGQLALAYLIFAALIAAAWMMGRMIMARRWAGTPVEAPAKGA
ncbi:MFS transporter [Methylovirgula sp. 4M-Z18]|uniref:MFS transporter n=1 Tax=Methylovirgula sp. 4M-Z18 TaxID=2293567 RepID=UPI001314EC10|nr:MFS transporter [Methylovirgula sp. 4M-Z18]